MVESYQPFPIMDFTIGEVTVREPWLIPQKAFVAILNGYIRNGILRKRLGYSEFAKMVHFVENENVPDTGQSASHTLSNIPALSGKPGSVVITDSSGTPKILTDDGVGGFTGDDNGSSINYTTGVISIEWDAVPTGPITVDYSYVPGLPIMGIVNYFTDVGTSEMLVFDTKRVAGWNISDSRLEDIAGTDRFSGTDTDFFQWDNWNGVVYFSNNKDPLDSYDGNSLNLITVDLGVGSIIFTCLEVFIYKDRLVTLHTTEAGTSFPQRARWTKPGSIDFTNDGFVDAPTSEFIVGAAFLRDDLVVFFERSIWFLKFSQDPSLPFKWGKIDSFNGSFATNSIIPFPSQIDAISATKMISTEGLPARIENEGNPDMLQEVNQEGFDYINAIFSNELGLQLIGFPSIGSTFNDSMFVRNKFNDAWSRFNIGFHAFGKWIVDQDLTWNDVLIPWEEIEWSWDDDTTQAGFPIILGGSADGILYKLNDTNTDNNASIDFSVLSGRLNPYVDKGLQARLGYVQFLVDKDDAVSLDISLYLDQNDTPYKIETITFDDDTPANADKVWKTVYSGAIGDFHQIGFNKNALGQTPIIHAVIPYFQPVEGGLR